ncbi:MAG: hypothetical protein IJD51_02075 [Clostridia bacterium]|nr:hypothetical protein [Clostridia bacterium]
MNEIGIEKEIDSLGRIYLPKSLRKLYNLQKNATLVATPYGILIKNPSYILVKLNDEDDGK